MQYPQYKTLADLIIDPYFIDPYDEENELYFSMPGDLRQSDIRIVDSIKTVVERRSVRDLETRLVILWA